jgi:hypothetical protein
MAAPLRTTLVDARVGYDIRPTRGGTFHQPPYDVQEPRAADRMLGNEFSFVNDIEDSVGGPSIAHLAAGSSLHHFRANPQCPASSDDAIGALRDARALVRLYECERRAAHYVVASNSIARYKPLPNGHLRQNDGLLPG